MAYDFGVHPSTTIAPAGVAASVGGRVMRYASGPRRKIVIGAFSVVLIAAYFYLDAQQYRAARWATTTQQPFGLEKAIAIEPGNASFHQNLGRYLFFSEMTPDRALPHFQEATRLNPYSGESWLDLAAILEFKGETERQKQAMLRALAAEPYTPNVLWTVANFYLVRGEVDEAVPLLRRFIEAKSSIDGAVDTTAIDVVWRATHNVDLLTGRLLPPTAQFRSTLVRFLLERNQPSEADLAWARLIELREPFDVNAGLVYVNFLLQKQAVEQAATAWAEMALAIPEFRAHVPSDDLVVNGGFEQEMLNGGFDWRLYPRPDTNLSVDTEQFHGGTRSLRIDFNGQPGADTGLVQTVSVKPNTRYRFTGFMRAESLLSSSGPRFLISSEKGERYFLSADLIGSSFWRESEAEFRTGNETKAIAISVVREPGSSRIKGTVWVDDISLQKLP
jgi:carbohydrate binding protein with CBM4/9 domain